MQKFVNDYWASHKEQWHVASFHVPLVLTAVFIIVAGMMIFNSRIEPIFDQYAAISGELSLADYPTYAQGVSVKVIFGLYNRIDYWNPISSNAHIRTIVMVVYLLSGLLLFSVRKSIRHKPALTTAMQVLLFTSLYAFLWTSHEVLAGAFLMLIFWSHVSGKPFVLTAFFLALFSLAKPDLALSGGLMGLYLVYEGGQTWRQRGIKFGIYAGVVLAFCLPGIISHGTGFFRTSRSLASFFQHYAYIASQQAVEGAPNPWSDTAAYTAGVFGNDVNSLIDVIVNYPGEYLTFVLSSLSFTLKNLFLGKVLVLLPLLVFALYRLLKRNCYDDPKIRSTLILALLVALGLVPITLMSVTHIRYLARFYPVVLFVIYTYLLQEEDKKIYWGSIGYLFVAVILQLPDFKAAFFGSNGHWFPD
ncbi:hypothetical protein ACFLYO_06030 [Chloroflexota bacterium]